MGEQSKSEPVEPVTEEVLLVARFIVDKCDMGRIGFISANAATEPKAIIHHPNDVIEYRHSLRYERDAIHPEDWPMPSAKLTLSGSGYQKYPSTPNAFYCNLGMYPLSSGLSVVQAIPYAWERPSYGYEHTGMLLALKELFGNSRQEGLEDYARINLGVVDAEGQVEPLRPFNPQAFGCDFISVLNEISRYATTQSTELSITLHEGKVSDYSEPPIPQSTA